MSINLSQWKIIADKWKYSSPPSIPSKEDLEIYKSFLEDYKGNLLVLGATPQLRDLVFELGFNTYTIDINREMILAMNKLRKYKDEKEIVKIANWLNTPFKNDFFDIIVGDCVLFNIEFDRKETFLKEVKRILKKDAYFITRTMHLWKTFKKRDNEEILKSFVESESDQYSQLCQELMMNNQEGTFDFKAVKKALEKYWKDGKYAHKNKKIEVVLNLIYSLWKPFEKKWYVLSEKDQDNILQKYFKIIKKKRATDYKSSQLFPIYKLSPKNP